MSERENVIGAQAAMVGDAVEALMLRFVEAGFAPAAVLAGAHGSVVVTIASLFGGAAAAERCQAAAEKVRDIPAATAMPALALAVPAGRA